MISMRMEANMAMIAQISTGPSWLCKCMRRAQCEATGRGVDCGELGKLMEHVTTPQLRPLSS